MARGGVADVRVAGGAAMIEGILLLLLPIVILALLTLMGGYPLLLWGILLLALGMLFELGKSRR